MGITVAALASSHAFAVLPPEQWDELRERKRYAQRYGVEAPVHPRVGEETWTDIETRCGPVLSGFATLRRLLQHARPDALKSGLSESCQEIV